MKSRLACWIALGLAACSNKSSGGNEVDASFDAGADVSFTEDAGQDGATEAAADVSEPTDTGSPADGAACMSAEAPDGACNTIVNAATAVTGTCPTGTQPSGTGGTIVDGTYTLTAQERYATGCVTASYQVTMVVAGGCEQRVDGTGASELRRNSTFATSGSTLTRTGSCGLSLPAATYTATATTITIFDSGGSVTTWTKQ